MYLLVEVDCGETHCGDCHMLNANGDCDLFNSTIENDERCGECINASDMCDQD